NDARQARRTQPTHQIKLNTRTYKSTFAATLMPMMRYADNSCSWPSVAMSQIPLGHRKAPSPPAMYSWNRCHVKKSNGATIPSSAPRRTADLNLGRRMRSNENKLSHRYRCTTIRREGESGKMGIGLRKKNSTTAHRKTGKKNDAHDGD